MLSQITSGTGSPQKLKTGKSGASAAFAYLLFKIQRSRPDTAFCAQIQKAIAHAQRAL